MMLAPSECQWLDIDANPDACRNLWRNVITQAWRDAFTGAGCEKYERSDAIAFLMRDSWTNERDHVCELAGVCPDRLREAAEIKTRELGSKVFLYKRPKIKSN